MTTAARVVGTGFLVLLLACGAYVTADAYDVVPGMVTLEDPPPEPLPFPTAPGAVEPAETGSALADLDPQAPVPLTAQERGHYLHQLALTFEAPGERARARAALDEAQALGAQALGADLWQAVQHTAKSFS